ncbi:MAG: MATE family efflux transporter [Oscillospiraceae bacterium]|nr:MATE family efflux transporter [Oscillospiraceae bacterium]
MEAVRPNRLFTNKMLIRLIVPLIIEQALGILVGMCDGMMISSAGEAAISGVSLVDMINNVIMTLMGALSTGGAVVTSQFLGAGDMDKARRSVGQLTLMAAVFGLIVMSFSLIFAEGMMNLFFGSIEADVMEAGLIYLRITALSFPFIALYNAGAAIFRCTGNSKISMKVSMLMNLINVSGNALCIFVLKMGVAGVAIPTLVSRAVGAVLILALASGKKHTLCLEWKNIFCIRRGMMGNILRIGIPNGIENSLFQLGRVVVVSMISLFGTVHISANSVANNLDALGYIVGGAFGTAMVTVIGQCVGARDPEQTSYYIKKLMLWDYIFQGLSNVLLLALLDPLVGLYSSLSPETVVLSKQLVWIHAGLGIFLWPAAFVLPNALRAASDVKFTMWAGIGSMVVWRIGFSWILCVQMELGALGVWIAMILDWICRTAFFVARIVRGKWKDKYKPSET